MVTLKAIECHGLLKGCVLNDITYTSPPTLTHSHASSPIPPNSPPLLINIGPLDKYLLEIAYENSNVAKVSATYFL